MSKRYINKVAVIGSGVMGSRIACHFANIGVQVLLLDIAPTALSAAEEKKGLALSHPLVKNRIVNEALQFALKSNPSPIYKASSAKLITTGNLDDDLPQIADVDWIIEVVVERLDIKMQVFEKIEQYRKKGSLITSNTSGIPIHLMIKDRSADFVDHFCGSHFFNPPRYLELLEIIPTPSTKQEVVDFLMNYGQTFLGKTTVLGKDTPAFIANRVGVYSIMSLFHVSESLDLGVDAIDKLTGPVLGRPKSATFRTCDVVGLDTLAHVANGVAQNCPDDEGKSQFEIPGFISHMLKEKWLGSKSGQGFYKKIKDEKGKSEILSLNLKTLSYESKQKVSFPTLELTKSIDNLAERTKVLFNGKDKAGEFYRKTFSGLFAYVSNRIPEIADEIFKIDDALKAGFGWELGPFESWDAVGFEAGLAQLKEEGFTAAAWIEEMKSAGFTSFYKVEKGVKKYYDVALKSYKAIPGLEKLVSLANLRESNTVWKNSGASIVDLGDGVINLEFHTKMNTIGGEVIEGLNKAIDLAEKEYKALVISNESNLFSAGANIGMIFMMAAEQDYDELDMAIRTFQNTMMRLRYSNIPVIAAPRGLTLGGGCELCMHADKVVAHAESYIGLVEFGVGVIPGGGGSKEFAVRISDEFNSGDIKINTLRNRFLTVGQAKVSTSAHEAFDLGYLRKGIDEVVMSKKEHLTIAKKHALIMADSGYTRPVERTDITVLGQEGLGIVYVGAHSMMSGNYMSKHDQLISEKLGYVLCGGDLSVPTQVSERYLLDIERKAFLELCMQPKTLERLQSMVKYGKVLRN
ncbi:MAG: 3-hydroxyacyl-CoA dehydrogenase [Flavobacteriales bacterium]|jgi:3-hydroxyacyl-CoA dehydrogenase